MKKVLMVLCHADDEIIFGWPILQDKSIEKEILICSSDLKHPDRKWCAHRKYVLFEICQALNIPVTCFDYNSEFYRTETRKESLSKLQSQIVEFVHSHEHDYVFTHNPLGEYGHLDHKMLFDLMLCYSRKPILITDITLKTNWPSHESIPQRLRQLYYTKPFTESLELNEELYQFCEDIYRKYKVWTWSTPPVKKCRLFELS